MTPRELIALKRDLGSEEKARRAVRRQNARFRQAPLVLTRRKTAPQFYLQSDWSTSAGQNVIRFNPVITSVPVLQCVQSDVGIVLNASTVSGWTDLSGQGKSYSQGTAANQPTFRQNDLNGFPSLRFDGTNDVLVSTLVLPAPGTTPTWVTCVVRSVSDPNGGGRFLSPNVSTNACLVLTRAGTSPNFSVSRHNSATVNNTSPLTTGLWYQIEAYFSNSSADYLRLGPTTTNSGSSAGNNSTGSGRSIGAQPAEPDPHNFDIVMCLYTQGLPTIGERNEIRNRIRNKYGSTVAV